LATNNDFSGGTGSLHRGSQGSRRSGARAALFWGVAILAGLSAALLITRYLDGHTIAASAPTTKIVVAATEMPLATRIRAEQVKLVDWPVDATPPGALHDVKDAIDRILTIHVLTGEPLVPGRLTAKGSGNGLAALIPGNMRAMAVHVDDVVGVAGFLHPDDRVDVIATLRPTRPNNAESTSKVILQNVRVLAVGKDLEVSDSNRAQATPTTVATLLVDSDGSEKLALAASEGRIILTLRGWTDNQEVATAGIKPSGLLPEATSAPVPAGPADPASPAPAHRAGRHDSRATPQAPLPASSVAQASGRKEIVEILRGDRFEERKFEARDKTEELK
jgi:pilus assembly protein CpaB